ncbi:hypothetical protein [Hydrogenophaga palleronii]|uniref:hypothetical protein n=1 Tax=Hydrogenophaga palleronii TaxID=65655 RepID=UPI0012ED9667|nr:hypothetical protein [Hydrogenophaga palleronii]
MHDQYQVARRFVESLNEVMSKELGTIVTALEGRLISKADELIVEVVCVLPAQMHFDWNVSGGNFDLDPYVLKERARTEWASALRNALLNEETIRNALPGLATAATRIRGSEVDALQTLIELPVAAYTTGREVPGEVVHATQGSAEFDLTQNFAFPVWDEKCTIRAKPSLARNGVVMELIQAPLGFIGRIARAHIDDIPAHCFQVIAGMVKRRDAIDLEVQLAKSPTKSKNALCKVHDVVVVT